MYYIKNIYLKKNIYFLNYFKFNDLYRKFNFNFLIYYFNKKNKLDFYSRNRILLNKMLILSNEDFLNYFFYFFFLSVNFQRNLLFFRDWKRYVKYKTNKKQLDFKLNKIFSLLLADESNGFVDRLLKVNNFFEKNYLQMLIKFHYDFLVINMLGSSDFKNSFNNYKKWLKGLRYNSYNFNRLLYRLNILNFNIYNNRSDIAINSIWSFFLNDKSSYSRLNMFLLWFYNPLFFSKYNFVNNYDRNLLENKSYEIKSKSYDNLNIVFSVVDDFINWDFFFKWSYYILKYNKKLNYYLLYDCNMLQSNVMILKNYMDKLKIGYFYWFLDSINFYLNKNYFSIDDDDINNKYEKVYGYLNFKNINGVFFNFYELFRLWNVVNLNIYKNLLVKKYLYYDKKSLMEEPKNIMFNLMGNMLGMEKIVKWCYMSIFKNKILKDSLFVGYFLPRIRIKKFKLKKMLEKDMKLGFFNKVNYLDYIVSYNNKVLDKELNSFINFWNDLKLIEFYKFSFFFFDDFFFFKGLDNFLNRKLLNKYLFDFFIFNLRDYFNIFFKFFLYNNNKFNKKEVFYNNLYLKNNLVNYINLKKLRKTFFLCNNNYSKKKNEISLFEKNYLELKDEKKKNTQKKFFFFFDLINRYLNFFIDYDIFNLYYNNVNLVIKYINENYYLYWFNEKNFDKFDIIDSFLKYTKNFKLLKTKKNYFYNIKKKNKIEFNSDEINYYKNNLYNIFFNIIFLNNYNYKINYDKNDLYFFIKYRLFNFLDMVNNWLLLKYDNNNLKMINYFNINLMLKYYYLILFKEIGIKNKINNNYFLEIIKLYVGRNIFSNLWVSYYNLNFLIMNLNFLSYIKNNVIYLKNFSNKYSLGKLRNLSNFFKINSIENDILYNNKLYNIFYYKYILSFYNYYNYYFYKINDLYFFKIYIMNLYSNLFLRNIYLKILNLWKKNVGNIYLNFNNYKSLEQNNWNFLNINKFWIKSLKKKVIKEELSNLYFKKIYNNNNNFFEKEIIKNYKIFNYWKLNFLYKNLKVIMLYSNSNKEIFRQIYFLNRIKWKYILKNDLKFLDNSKKLLNLFSSFLYLYKKFFLNIMYLYLKIFDLKFFFFFKRF